MEQTRKIGLSLNWDRELVSMLHILQAVEVGDAHTRRERGGGERARRHIAAHVRWKLMPVMAMMYAGPEHGTHRTQPFVCPRNMSHTTSRPRFIN